MKVSAVSLARPGSGWAKQAGAIEDCSIHGSVVLGETADIFRIAYDPCYDISGSGSIAYLIDYAVSAYMSCGPPGVCDNPGHDTFGADDLSGYTCGACSNRYFGAYNLDRSPLYEAIATWDPIGKAQ